jgi:hypothetical protein
VQPIVSTVGETEVQPIVSTVGATFVQEYLGWLQGVHDKGEGPAGDRRRAALTLGR